MPPPHSPYYSPTDVQQISLQPTCPPATFELRAPPPPPQVAASGKLQVLEKLLRRLQALVGTQRQRTAGLSAMVAVA